MKLLLSIKIITCIVLIKTFGILQFTFIMAKKKKNIPFSALDSTTGKEVRKALYKCGSNRME